VDIQRARIPTACLSCSESRVSCSGALPGCDQCRNLSLDCGPNAIPDDTTLQGKTKKSGIEDNENELERMINDLELEGWHFVSREEVKEAVEVGSGRK
jgi:hypothetical protein